MSLKNNEKRVIRVKSPQLQRFRTAMRKLLKASLVSERRKLREISSLIEIDDIDLWVAEKKKIERQIEELDRAGFRAPLGCRLCGCQNLDLVFNPCNSQWFCERCYTFNQEDYKREPHPYEPDWRKLYP